MKVLSKKIESRQAFLTIELDPAEVEASLDKSYARLVKKTSVPGFRKGKAPRAVLEQHMGKENLLEDALNDLLPKACADAIQEEKIEAFAQPVINVTQTDPVVFKAKVPLPPEVELGDYHRIRIKPERVKLSNNEVDAVIEQLRHQHATFEPVERPVMAKDLVGLDISSSIGDKPFIDKKGAPYQVLPDSSFPALGFAEQLLGMKRDEEKEFKLKLPEDYPDSEQAGKEVLFRVKVVEVKKERLPELNDDFAKGVAPGVETLDSLREQIAADLKKRTEEKARLEYEERVIDAVAKESRVEYPPILVDMEVDRMINQELRRWQMAARSREEYLERLNRTPVEELRRELHPYATQRVTKSLVLGEVVKAEKIEVNDAEIDAEIERMTENAGQKKEEQQKFLNSPQPREQVRQLLTTQKTIQRLVEIARGSRKKIKKGKKEAK